MLSRPMFSDIAIRKAAAEVPADCKENDLDNDPSPSNDPPPEQDALRLLAPQRGLIATGQNQDRDLIGCIATNWNPDGPGEAYSSNRQTFAATLAEPGDLPTD